MDNRSYSDSSQQVPAQQQQQPAQQQQPCTSRSPPTGKGGSPIDMDKLRQKLQRAYLRRDHYAQLYYQTKSELEEAKWELSKAHDRIRQLQSHDRNSRISPDSGAVSMSPGVESTEGHGQLEDESEGQENNKLNRSSVKMNGNEALSSSVEIKPTKRVVFREGPQHSSYDKINGMTTQGGHVFQRSYTLEGGDFTSGQHFMEKGAGPGSMNTKMQRTASYSQGLPITQFSTFPGSYPMMQQQSHFNNSSTYSLPLEQHRLPRVHRGMNYDGNMIPPPMMSPPYHQALPPPRIIQQHQAQQHQVQQHQVQQHQVQQHQVQQHQVQQHQVQQHQVQQHQVLPPRPPGMPPPQQQSAFQRVPKQGSFKMHQYENINYPVYYTNHQPPNFPPPSQDHHQKQSYGEKWTYSGLQQEEFLQLLNHLASPNNKVESLEISRSNLGRPNLMNILCKELRKNTSIRELSLPSNDIGKESLRTLLLTVTNCKSIRELKLVNNDIGEDCLDILKQFLEQSTLKSLVLSGNEIEHHTHLLDSLLPQDLQYEGVQGSKSSPVSPDIAQNMKLLKI